MWITGDNIIDNKDHLINLLNIFSKYRSIIKKNYLLIIIIIIKINHTSNNWATGFSYYIIEELFARINNEI